MSTQDLTASRTPEAGGRHTLEPRFLSPDVLRVLRCPTSRQPLEPRIIDGKPALSTPDGAHVYPVRDGVPILLPLPPAPQGSIP